MSRARRLASWAIVAWPFLIGGCGDRYPIPALASSSPPVIRVLLGKERAEARLSIPAQSWEVSSKGGRVFSHTGSTDLLTTIKPSPTGSIVLDGRDTGAPILHFRPASYFTVDNVSYAGTLIVRREGARLLLVNELDLETYIAGVIANELAPGATPSTFRAQAVAARTYAWIKLSDPTSADPAFHLFDSDRSQVYRGLTIPPVMVGHVTTEETLLRAAETRGVVLTWQGRPFRAWYSSTCGGHTTDPWTGLQEAEPGLEPLRGVPCRFCATSPKFSWDVQVGDEDLVAGFAKDKRPISLPIRAIEITENGRGGWVRWIRVTYGPKGDVKDVPGAVFRRLARLQSHRLGSITRVAGGWRFVGGGWGHGVGMCQWGALEMGRQGFTETDILRYYYPGVAFTKVY